MTKSLKGIHILVGVTGGIAAYKSPDLVRRLVKEGASVQVIMSQSATRFTTPLTLATLSGRQVAQQMFDDQLDPLLHIDVSKGADLFLIAPATADFLARAAQGRAEDLISSVTLAFDGQVVVAPAMNTNMWNNPATIRNIKTLTDEHHFQVIPPGVGELACGVHGAGRMADPAKIVDWIISYQKRDLVGKTVVVSAGPTVEDIDPVRYISNRSSGKTGYAIAEAAKQRGAQVHLISGPVNTTPPAGVSITNVRSALEMEKALLAKMDADAVIMAAAVADVRPANPASEKIKKEAGLNRIDLIKNPDILKTLSSHRGPNSRPFLVGFALETQSLIENAQAKLTAKGVDLLVANLASEALEGDKTKVTFLRPNSAPSQSDLMTKTAMANQLLDLVFEP